MKRLPLQGKLSPQATDEGQPCRGLPFTGCHGRAAPVCGRGRRHLPPRGKAFSFRKRVILDVDRSLVLTVAVGAGAAELTVGAGGSAAGAERLGVNAAAVQILRHIDEKSVQMVADAAQLGRVGQRAFGVQRLAGLGAEGQRHKLAGALRVHGAVDALLVQQQAVHRVGRGGVGIVAQLAAVHALGRGVGQQVFDARRRRARELPLGVALQREKIQKHLAVEAAVDLLQLKLLAATVELKAEEEFFEDKPGA